MSTRKNRPDPIKMNRLKREIDCLRDVLIDLQRLLDSDRCDGCEVMLENMMAKYSYQFNIIDNRIKDLEGESDPTLRPLYW